MSSPPAASLPFVRSPAALGRVAPVLPVVAVIALMGLPSASDGGASPADAACGLAVLWAAVSGTFVALARMLAQRKAASYYVKSKGHLPPQLQKGDAVPNTST